jgi:hypothetical protein
VKTAHKVLATGLLLLLFALVGVLVALHRDRAVAESGLDEPVVTQTELKAAPLMERTENGLEPEVSNKALNAAPVVKNRVRVSDYEARRRELIARWESAHAERSGVARERQDDGTSTSDPPPTLSPRAGDRQ